MNKSFNNQINKDGTPKVDKTREIIKQTTLNPAAAPVNVMPAPVSLAMNMVKDPMAFYNKMTTPAKAPFDMPKPAIPKVNIAEDKGFVVVVGKMINEKISKTKEPITLKGNLSQTTNINIGVVNVKADNAKDFTDRLKGATGSKIPASTPGKQNEIDPTFNQRR